MIVKQDPNLKLTIDTLTNQSQIQQLKNMELIKCKILD